MEVGYAIFSPELQKTIATTEVHFHLMSIYLIFWGIGGTSGSVTGLNVPSRKAAMRLGFKYKGMFPQEVVYKCRSRDTQWMYIREAFREQIALHSIVNIFYIYIFCSDSKNV
ncbi:CPA_1a_G0028090.mRNA.1.CDS.1 [Saccharomyces cerevisiae]|nr:CPA_1a_G0028090.mRNA.1.CDS.1 [Saccharomyces cerevisiae]CAI4526067.1 CPI_1c_G0027480.mRNA.1.CDS.1 [Saccharomyces cerevisiae]CAI4536972.1 BBM_1a_G0027660.mRNA.1.CDS.1 [Saccharomyces cerevisiae]CAI7162258.1 BBM_1a_G0027660.mRNA.1.CDS.1 [Saccharomyces cerevisiae]CAI7343256.1 CPI_1c_G0027480.mRNA.1.CDS.1 [Saccharomyces cerevisiae]